MPNLGVTLQQPAGEHDLVTKGGFLDMLLGGDGVHPERLLLDNPGQLGIRLESMDMVLLLGLRSHSGRLRSIG